MNRLLLMTVAGMVLSSQAGEGVSPCAVRSPDGRNEIVLNRGVLPTWEVRRDGRAVLAPAPLGLGKADVSAAKGSVRKFSTSGHAKTPVYKKAEIDLASNRAVVPFVEGVSVELAARNDGVAWRFVVDRPVTVVSETADVRFADANCDLYAGVITCRPEECNYWHSADPFQHSAETPFVKTTPAALMAGEPKAIAYLPLTGRTPSGTWFCLKDTDVRDYPGWHLARGGDGAFRGVFAKEPDVSACYVTNVFCRVTKRLDRLAALPRARTLPWRCVVLGDRPGDLAEADLLAALAESPKGDFSWVEPGLVTWNWWCAHYLPDLPYKAGNNTATYCHYIDFAAANGLPYVLLDGGWLVNNDLHRPQPGVDLDKVLAYAKTKGRKVILWCAWVSLFGHVEESFAEFAARGVAGFKIDFFDRDDVIESRFLSEIAERAAAHRLVLLLHGCQVPNGLQRTWPNVLNFEAVRGLENAKWDERVRDFPNHDVRLVFTRFVAGPADYTPGAMANLSRAAFRVNGKAPCVAGTRVHQMALYTAFEAPLQMLCDSPTLYRRNPECLKFLAASPTVWDETRVLAGTPDDYAVVARRKGKVWQVGAITGWTPCALEIDTRFLGSGEWEAEVFADAPDADVNAERYVRTVRRVTAGERLKVRLAPGGGWTARLRRTAKNAK